MRKLRLLGIFLIPILAFNACRDKTIGGNGIVKEKTYQLEDFHTLSLKGAFEVHLYPSNKAQLKLVADENLIPEISIEVSDSSLEIAPKKNIIRSRELKLYIGSPSIRTIILSGASEIVTDTLIQSTNFSTSISGTGKLSLKLLVNNLNLNISGGAEVALQGKSTQFSCSITGIGKIEANDFVTENTNIDISGYGHAVVNATKNLNINVSGFGKIFYVGNPVVKQNITGSAKVKQKQKSNGEV
ncbi:MAG: DUF2807 domain-containing protein [Bacteroidales bacterium]|nr:DUF2807 domain-containing protein [Bacteroidales bacterium]